MKKIFLLFAILVGVIGVGLGAYTMFLTISNIINP
jgi:ABC-type lipoprotein release transport system permease subunit